MTHPEPRNLFAEIAEGFVALAGERDAKPITPEPVSILRTLEP